MTDATDDLVPERTAASERSSRTDWTAVKARDWRSDLDALQGCVGTALVTYEQWDALQRSERERIKQRASINCIVLALKKSARLGGTNDHWRAAYDAFVAVFEIAWRGGQNGSANRALRCLWQAAHAVAEHIVVKPVTDGSHQDIESLHSVLKFVTEHDMERWDDHLPSGGSAFSRGYDPTTLEAAIWAAGQLACYYVRIAAWHDALIDSTPTSEAEYRASLEMAEHLHAEVNKPDPNQLLLPLEWQERTEASPTRSPQPIVLDDGTHIITDELCREVALDDGSRAVEVFHALRLRLATPDDFVWSYDGFEYSDRARAVSLRLLDDQRRHVFGRLDIRNVTGADSEPDAAHASRESMPLVDERIRRIDEGKFTNWWVTEWTGSALREAGTSPTIITHYRTMQDGVEWETAVFRFTHLRRKFHAAGSWPLELKDTAGNMVCAVLTTIEHLPERH